MQAFDARMFDVLPPEERERALKLLDAMTSEGLAEQITRVYPHQPPPRHVMPLIDLFERARRERVFACISWPPRHAKSISAVRGLAWWLQHTPADTCAYVTYSDRQAWMMSRKIRIAARKVGVMLHQAGLHDIAATVGEWRTPLGGGLFSVGAGGGLLGKGVSGVVVCDDPYPSREKAESEAYKEKIWEWFNEVVYTRLEGGSVIVIHQRWVDDDLIGRLSKRGDWEVISLPAEAQENDPIGRRPGEALWPERYPLEELAKIKSQMGDWNYAALYEQRPRPRGFAVFQAASWFDPNKTSLEGCKVFLGADPAASERKKADASVCYAIATRGTGPNRIVYVLDEIRGQWSVPEFARRLRDFQAGWYGAPIAIEAVGGFKAVPQMLRELDPYLKIKEVFPSLDKFQRAQPLAAAWNTGRVLFPMGRNWTGPAIAEFSDFTGADGRSDDRIDALSMAFDLGNHPPPKGETFNWSISR